MSPVEVSAGRPAVVPASTAQALSMIANERMRQLGVEGYVEGHDDEHGVAELAEAARAYAAAALRHATPVGLQFVPISWPWDNASFKPRGTVEDLVRAGALIAAALACALRERDRAGTQG